jgi:predicted permease
MALRLDPRVLVFAFVLAFATSMLFGIVPAFRGSRVALVAGLGLGGSRSSNPGRPVLRALLVIAQVAISVVLVVGTGLFVRTLRNLQSEELGYDRDHLLLIWALPGHTGRSSDAIRDLWPRVQDRLGALPGAVSAAVSVEGLLPGGPANGPLLTRSSGDLGDTVRVVQTMTVSTGFFSTVGQPLRAGRDFTSFDTDSAPPVIIVNEALAARVFGRGDLAVGQDVRIRGTPLSYRIIGVVGNGRQAPRAPTGPAVYYPPAQNVRRLSRGMGIVVRARGNPADLTRDAREALRAIDPNLPILSVQTINSQLNQILFQERLIASLSLGFGALAVVLSCVGLYGVVSYVTTRRRKEIGIRMALGARRSGVLTSVLRDSIQLAAAGIAIGVIGAIAVNRSLTSLLFGIGATDPLTIGLAAVVITVVAALAGLIPAHHASRVNPVVALRSD